MPKKKILKIVGLGLLGAFVVLQGIRPEKNLADAPSPQDLLVLHPASPEIKQWLHAACYDCHSNTTRYPWYAEIQPIGWLLANHVKEAKEHFNFSTFGDYSTKRALHKLEEAINLVEMKEMPLASYTLIHRDAKFTATQIAALTSWFEDVYDNVESTASALD